MKRLMDLGRHKPWFGLGLMAVLAAVGALALTQDHAADAALIGNELTLDTTFVVSGGVVEATLETQDDVPALGTGCGGGAFPPGGASGCDDSQIFGPDTNIAAFNAANTGGIRHVSCIVGGVACLLDFTATFGPVVCDQPAQAGDSCIQYGDGGVDADGTLESMTIVVDITITCTVPTLVPITGWANSADTETIEVLCLPLDDPNITVTKEFTPALPGVPVAFLFNGSSSCYWDTELPAVDPQPIADGQGFFLEDTESAYFFCPFGDYTFTELQGEGWDFVSSECVAVIALPLPSFIEESAVDVVINDEGDDYECTFINEPAEVVVDSSDLILTKACVGEIAAATFTVDLLPLEAQTDPALTPAPIACGQQIIIPDLEPGGYTLLETIAGPDASAITTTIFCIDAAPVGSTSTTVTIVEGSDQSCVLVNFFDPDGAEEPDDADGDGIPDALEALICGCPIDIEIDLDNTNTNTIGIDNDNLNNNANNNDNANTNDNDNENKNDNDNENTQDQDNTQDQNNTNDQTNNITSSPEVNIDFDE